MEKIWVIVESEVHGDSSIVGGRFYHDEKKAKVKKSRLDFENASSIKKYPNSGTFFSVVSLTLAGCRSRQKQCFKIEQMPPDIVMAMEAIHRPPPKNLPNMQITLENGERKALVKIEADKGKWVYVTTEDGDILHTTWADITTLNNALTQNLTPSLD